MEKCKLLACNLCDNRNNMLKNLSDMTRHLGRCRNLYLVHESHLHLKSNTYILYYGMNNILVRQKK